MLRVLLLWLAVGVSQLGAQVSAVVAPAGWVWRPVVPLTDLPRVVLIYDMEGLSGVDRHAMTVCRDAEAYATGQDRLEADVNAVVEGLASAGVKVIDVIDRHGSGCDGSPDLPANRLDHRAKYVDEQALGFFPRLSQHSWDAIVLVGGHASPGWGGFLEHTGSFGYERIINGVSISESEQQGLSGGGQGVPVIFASGDDRYAAQLAQRMPWVTFVAVKQATSRTTARLRPADEVRADLVRQAQASVRARDRAMLMTVVAPHTGAYRPVWPNSLDAPSAIPGVDISAGEIRVTGTNLREINEAINAIATVVNGVHTSKAHWEEVKLDSKRDRFRDSLFMARWVAGPPPVVRP